MIGCQREAEKEPQVGLVIVEWAGSGRFRHWWYNRASSDWWYNGRAPTLLSVRLAGSDTHCTMGRLRHTLIVQWAGSDIMGSGRVGEGLDGAALTALQNQMHGVFIEHREAGPRKVLVIRKAVKNQGPVGDIYIWSRSRTC
jgi:hypothetical protein